MAVLPGRQSGVEAPEDGRGRDGAPRIHEHHVCPHLPQQRIGLVAAAEAERRAAEQEERHVGAEATGERVQARRTEAEAPQLVEADEDGRRVTAAAAEPTACRYALGDVDGDPGLDPRVAAQRVCRLPGEVALVGRNPRGIAGERDAGARGAQLHVVVEGHGLEDRPQLVVAVLAGAEHLEAEVHLRVGRDDEGPHRHSARASPAGSSR